MKKVLFLSALLVGVWASMAFAQGGISLAWDDCQNAGGNAGDQAFACTSNTGTFVLSPAFDSPVSIQYTGEDVLIDIQSASATLPNWWNLNSSTGSDAAFGTFCRSGKMATLDPAGLSGAGCTDAHGGLALPGVRFESGTQTGAGFPTSGHVGPDRGRIWLTSSVNTINSTTPGTWYYTVAATMNAQKTVGTGACAGCGTGVCLVLNNITAYDLNSNNQSMDNAESGFTRFVTWNGGTGGGCPGATPTKNSSWGSIKALYR